MVRKLVLAVVVVALACALTVAQEKKKFASLKECMMCLKMNQDMAAAAVQAGDMKKAASAADMLKQATMCMNKDYCPGKTFAECGKSFCEAVEKLEKAAKESNKQAAADAVVTIKKGCMGCHEKCRK